MLAALSSNYYAQETNAGLGEKLTKEFWTVLKSGEIDSFSDRISEEFLALHQYGAGRKAEEIKLMKTIKLGDYTLSDFTEMESGNTIIVTYKVTADEELGGQKINPAYRMTVWQTRNDVWLLTAHCNMTPFFEKGK